MIRYEVTLTAAPSLTEQLEEWMRREHIPAILATGCFLDIRFDRGPSGPRTVYHAATQADLDRYLADHATGFREDFQRHFPTGVTASRSVWTELEHWQGERSG